MAILGSVLAASYAAHLGSTVDALPAPARESASQSIVATLAAVDEVQASGDEDAARAAAAVVAPAREAFVSAMHVTAVFTAGAAVVAALVVLRWLPGRRRTVVARVTD